jgi:hypothetical protein
MALGRAHHRVSAARHFAARGVTRSVGQFQALGLIFYGKHDVALAGTLTSIKTALNEIVTLAVT